MAEILTTKFKSDTTRLFVEDLKSNNYYMMVSGIDRMDSDNTKFSQNEFLENVLFGKKVFQIGFEQGGVVSQLGPGLCGAADVDDR